jgi:hypothetical protein
MILDKDILKTGTTWRRPLMLDFGFFKCLGVFMLLTCPNCCFSEDPKTVFVSPSIQAEYFLNIVDFPVNEDAECLVFHQLDSFDEFTNRFLTEVIPKFPNISTLRFSSMTEPLSIKTVECLKDLRKLDQLTLFGEVKLTPESLASLLELPLKCLSMYNIPVGGHIRFLNTSRLKGLCLHKAGLANSAIATIGNAHDLISLDVSHNPELDMRFVKGLGRLEHLQQLQFINPSAEEEELDSSIFPVLNAMSKFKAMTCAAISVTDEEIERLTASGELKFRLHVMKVSAFHGVFKDVLEAEKEK